MSTLAYPPISQPYRILDGFDVHRSDKLIIAFVAVETPQGPKIRMYRWQKRNDSWKIDLCRMSVEWWDWATIPNKISKLRERYFGNPDKSSPNNNTKSSPPDNLGGLISIETDFPVIDEEIPEFVDRKGRLSGYEGFDGNFKNCKAYKQR